MLRLEYPSLHYERHFVVGFETCNQFAPVSLHQGHPAVVPEPGLFLPPVELEDYLPGVHCRALVSIYNLTYSLSQAVRMFALHS